MIFFIIIIMILTIYGFSNFFIAKNIFTWLLIVGINIPDYIFYSIYLISAASVILTFSFPSRFIIKKYISLFSYYWMGIYFYLLLGITTSSIILKIYFKYVFVNSNLQQLIILVTGWVLLILVSVLLIYGRLNARDVKLTSYEVEINKKIGKSSLKIALISDIHLNAINDYKHFNKIVGIINNLDSDIVCFVGDIFDGDYYILENPEKLQGLIKSIKSKYGTYACLGNHDAGKTYPKMIEFLEESSVHVLEDEYIIVDNKFAIAGRSDSSPIGAQGETRREFFDSIEYFNDLPVIVLDHQPSNISEYNLGVDLVLCGHTHKGQMFPANYITKAIFEVDYGYYQKDQNSPQVIATSGVGTWGPPFRIGTNNEVVLINVKFDG